MIESESSRWMSLPPKIEQFDEKKCWTWDLKSETRSLPFPGAGWSWRGKKAKQKMDVIDVKKVNLKTTVAISHVLWLRSSILIVEKQWWRWWWRQKRWSCLRMAVLTISDIFEHRSTMRERWWFWGYHGFSSISSLRSTVSLQMRLRKQADFKLLQYIPQYHFRTIITHPTEHRSTEKTNKKTDQRWKSLLTVETLKLGLGFLIYFFWGGGGGGSTIWMATFEELRLFYLQDAYYRHRLLVSERWRTIQTNVTTWWWFDTQKHTLTHHFTSIRFERQTIQKLDSFSSPLTPKLTTESYPFPHHRQRMGYG